MTVPSLSLPWSSQLTWPKKKSKPSNTLLAAHPKIHLWDLFLRIIFSVAVLSREMTHEQPIPRTYLDFCLLVMASTTGFGVLFLGLRRGLEVHTRGESFTHHWPPGGGSHLPTRGGNYTRQRSLQSRVWETLYNGQRTATARNGQETVPAASPEEGEEGEWQSRPLSFLLWVGIPTTMDQPWTGGAWGAGTLEF